MIGYSLSKNKKMKLFLSIFLFIFIFTSCTNTSTEQIKEDKNETLETIFNRKSVRQYTAQIVEDEKLETLVRAGMAAPSSRDRRPWEFIIVKDREKLDRMAEGLPFGKMLKETKQAIIVCGDSQQSDNAWFLDCSAAAQNILLAAESMGLGAVWTAAYPYPDRIQIVRETLSIPEHVIPLTVIPIGYPQGKDTPKNKFNIKKIHYDRW